MATANHLEAEPFGYANGEVGVVAEVDPDGTVTVEFASGPAEVKGKALVDLLHGWAITVHRAQGSEFAGVVVALMVTPIACSIMREAFGQAPIGEREGAYALGATRWGMILRANRRPWARRCPYRAMMPQGQGETQFVARQVVTSQSRRNGQTQRRGGNGRLQNSAVIQQPGLVMA